MLNLQQTGNKRGVANRGTRKGTPVFLCAELIKERQQVGSVAMNDTMLFSKVIRKEAKRECNLFSFIKYDFVELLIIVACAALFMIIWDFFF